VTIALMDPKSEYLAFRNEIDGAIARVLNRGLYILGPEVEAFEREFANYLGTGETVGVGNGTDAIFLALKAAGIGPGDGVLTVSHTANATVSAIEAAGAVPIFVDIDPTTYGMDPSSLEAAIHKARGRVTLKAVMPVHLYGHPVDIDAILAIAKKHGLPVIEDCAQCHGAKRNGGTTGTFGDMAAFSFYPTKNLGALGDGGAVFTTRPELANRLRLLREYGWKDRYIAAEPGYNTRLDELQAAILREKLKHLKDQTERRRTLAKVYREHLQGLVQIPAEAAGAESVYHLFVVGVDQRDSVRERLKSQGIGTGIHYPMPIHLQPAYAGRIPVEVPMVHTERAAGRVMSLPMYPQLPVESAVKVAEVLASVLRSPGA